MPFSATVARISLSFSIGRITLVSISCKRALESVGAFTAGTAGAKAVVFILGAAGTATCGTAVGILDATGTDALGNLTAGTFTLGTATGLTAAAAFSTAVTAPVPDLTKFCAKAVTAFTPSRATTLKETNQTRFIFPPGIIQ